MKRTITITLTERQYLALASAVDERQEQYESGDLDGISGATGEYIALRNAWNSLSKAWHAPKDSPTTVVGEGKENR